MNSVELASSIYSHLPFAPHPLQERLVAALAAFVSSPEPHGVFLLNGYAGSGKTSIIGAMIRALTDFKKRTVTLAPTGRAAKVAADFSGGKAFTIHKHIYRADSQTPDAKFFLAPNNDRDTVYIIDEASLITHSPYPAKSLLYQLARYVYSAPGNAMILIGDIAQLPPVGMSESPAMNPDVLRAIGLNPVLFTLDIVLRQNSESGILHNATYMRQLLFSPIQGMKPLIFTTGFGDVEAISSADLADRLSESWNEAGIDETVIITRSNSRANKYNIAIRNMVMMADGPLQQGDRLVIAKNDYYWSKINKLNNFIANGDIAEVKWVGRTEKYYGRYFAEVELYFPSSGNEIGAKLMLRSLMAEGPSIPREEMDRFYTRVLAEQEGELSHKIKAAIEDPYYNALQAKYAYCLTCHKAQGGQWRHVYIDMSGIDPETLDESFYRWYYTAMTRATSKVFFINPTLPVK